MKSNKNTGRTIIQKQIVLVMFLMIVLTKGSLFAQWSGGTTPADSIYRSGSVAIGFSTAPTSIGTYKLLVNGTIKTKDLNVTTQGWSDFVFESDYKLMPLNDLESFITQNKHLPDIPTETEVKENGVSVGDMQAKLLQKVEELTLYLIEENKKFEEQSDILRMLQEENSIKK